MKKKQVTNLKIFGIVLLVMVGLWIIKYGSRPFLADIYFKRGLKAGEKGDFLTAIEEIKRAAYLHHKEPIYHQSLGAYYLQAAIAESDKDRQQRLFNQAAAGYHVYINMVPQDARGHNAAGSVYVQMGHYLDKKYFRTAIDYLRKAVELDPHLIEAVNNLGAVYALLDFKEEAVAIYQKAIEENPENVDLYFNLGFVCFRSGDMKKAEDYWEKTLEIDPEHVDAKRGLALLKKGGKK
jgi:tetratricopeptide (TPR) repeat protein